MRSQIVFLFLLLSVYAFSQQETVEVPASIASDDPVTIGQASGAPVIDGTIDPAEWSAASVFETRYETYPGENSRPVLRTEVLLMSDETNLYAAFRCFDEAGKVRATVARRDDILSDDNVRIWLDTFDDRRRAYVFAFNPFGIQQDGIYTEGENLPDYSVDFVHESRGEIHEWGWSVEVRIPYKSLRYKAGDGALWGFNFVRNIKRLNSTFDAWMPQDRNRSGTLVQHGRITGFGAIRRERTLELVPSVTVRETERRVRNIPGPKGETGNGPTERFVNQPVEADLGLTLKYTITPNITLDAAINPDFAEIEADAPIVTANLRFPVFFTEKRPFFLEGAEIFTSPLDVFYSRSIIDPDAAAKLTGKVGRNSFGFLFAADGAPGKFEEEDLNDPSVRPRIDEFVGKKALFGVVRAKRDVGKDSSVGLFGTARSFPEQRNFLGGIDGRFRVDDSTVFTFQAVGTHSRRCFFEPAFDPVRDPAQAMRNSEICGGSTFNAYRTGNGIGYYARAQKDGKTHGWQAEFIGRSRFYRADAGFTERSDLNDLFLYNRVNKNPEPDAALVSLRSFQFWSAQYDFRGRFQNMFTGANVSFGFQNSTSLFVETAFRAQKIYEDEFGISRNPGRDGAFFGAPDRLTRQSRTFAIFSSAPVKQFSVRIRAQYNYNAFDFDFGAGRYPRVSPAAISGDPRLDPGGGRELSLQASAEYRPIEPFRISVSYNRTSLKRFDTGLAAFVSDITSVRSTYQFTRFMYARIRLDYNSLRRNASGQALFGWSPNPGTAFYAGYTDDFNYNGFSPVTRLYEPGFARNSRTFFIRASYLFRKTF
ncbi:MAG: hypothetical protein DWQ47_04645 [Acidobacteria bacterium]|nr:MAG: hypothetical protein DWQ32_08195 [Acidobacteriota bacterium]REK01676.1 MAG: hypothetical protein DWQ38_04630 [Acidobacteriota bacterium]REK14632.1 MAG: hypothetical protein DWQ43_13885 [Acidobacteriota bacterium]REK45347.1 MAG: hypothetical protein DWQ47_04645 [Acidobacteriota bacterium]